MPTDVNKIVDNIFGILLLLLFLVCIVLVVVKGLIGIGDPDMLERGINSALGSGGAGGAATLYFKWRLIRETKAELNAEQLMELLKKTKKDEDKDA